MEIYAVFIKTSTHIPGDQRSIDYPGHGYPAYTLEKTEVKEFKNKDEFLEWVNNQEHTKYGKVSYRAFKCIPLKVTTTVSIGID